MYFEVIDPEKKQKCIDWATGRNATTKAALRFSRRVGGSRRRVASSNSIFARRFGIYFSKTPDEKLWKQDETKTCWIPRRGSKAARKLSDELRQIENMDGNYHCDLGKIIGLDFLHCPGIRITKDDRVFISVGDDWKVPRKGLKRISDIEYEKLTQAQPR